MNSPPYEEIRCPHCTNLLFKSQKKPEGIEIVCKRCRGTVRWPLEEQGHYFPRDLRPG